MPLCEREMSDLTVDDRAVVNGETVAAAFESKGGQPTGIRGPSSATSGGRMRSKGIRGAGFCSKNTLATGPSNT